MNLPLNIDFTGKVVVVTGAGGVLCGTMAKAFAQAGAKVAALDLNEEAVKKLADECKAEGLICEGYKANVLEPEALEAVHGQVLKDLGPCDILVNGAGGNNPRATTDNEYQHEAQEGQKTFFDLDAGGVDFVFKLNFQGTLLPTQAFAKDMVEKKSGCILNISSIWGECGASCEAVYSASKGGLNAFTKAMAKELGPSNIRVNAISCGVIDTQMNACFSLEERQALAEEIPLMRFGKPEDAAALALFLASPEAAFLTGKILTLDGGML